MLSWSTIAYGATLSALSAAILVAVAGRPGRVTVIVTAAASAFLGPFTWNAILRATQASSFFHDAPLAIFPVSWQDTGSGVFALATATMLLGLGPLARDPSHRLVALALLTALPSLLIDVYLY